MKEKITPVKAIFIALLVLYLLAMVFPLVYLVSASFMTEADLSAIPAKLIPSSLQIGNYVTAFTRQPISAIRAQ